MATTSTRNRAGRLKGTHVLVTGAGLAGLAAAERLEHAGATVTIVEARDRVGGRVWTCRDAFEQGQHAEAGADIIEHEQTAVLDLAKRLGLSLTRTLAGGFAYYGPSRNGPHRIQTGPRAFAVLGERLAPLIRDYTIAERRWDGAFAQRLAKWSVADWLRVNRVPQWVRARVEAMRGLFLADVADLSMLALVDFLAETPSAGQPGGMLRVVGGNDLLATTLAGRLDATIEMEATLVRVRQTKDRVTATLVRRGRRAEWQGHFLVSATPASTLRDVVFRPALPEVQAVAVRKLEYGPATRALVQFDRRFWRRARRPVAFATNLSCGALWDGNQEQRGRAGILSFLAGGSAARSLADLLTADGPSGLLRKIRWLGPPANVLHAKVFRWDRDPWARGGYACFDPGFDPRWREALALPFGRVVFAGEHTSIRWQGYMNGAIESGQRAAAEIESLAAH